MASTSAAVGDGKAEELEERMNAFSDMLKIKVSEEDRVSFQFFLRELQQQKATLQKKKLGSFIVKYGHASSAQFSAPPSAATHFQVITVNSPSPQPSTSFKGDMLSQLLAVDH